MNEQKSIYDIAKAEYDKGNIIIARVDGLATMDLNDFIKQPTDGMLYDLNRDEVTISTFVKNDNPKWVNDYAVCKVIRKLKERIEELENDLQIETLINN